MPMLEVAEFETDLRDQVTRSGLCFRFGEKQLKLKHLHPRNELAARLSGDHWAFGCNLQTKDVDFEYRTTMKHGELFVRQRIPQAQWELFPTPEFKFTTNSVDWGKFNQRLAVSYDLLTSRGRVEETLEYNKKYKLKISADTTSKLGGALVSIRNKLDRSWAKTIGLDYSMKSGPVLTYETEPNKQFELLAALSLQKKQLWTSFEVAPSAGSRIRLHAEATVSKSSVLKPALRLGARYDV